MPAPSVAELALFLLSGQISHEHPETDLRIGFEDIWESPRLLPSVSTEELDVGQETVSDTCRRTNDALNPIPGLVWVLLDFLISIGLKDDFTQMCLELSDPHLLQKSRPSIPGGIKNVRRTSSNCYLDHGGWNLFADQDKSWRISLLNPSLGPA